MEIAKTVTAKVVHNDIEMLKEAHFSFAMKNAHPDIKKIANFETKNNDNFGLENVLEKLIESKVVKVVI